MSEKKTLETLGTLLGVAYLVGMPIAFIVIEIVAATVLTGFLSWALWGIALWNLYVLSVRTWGLARLTSKAVNQ